MFIDMSRRVGPLVCSHSMGWIATRNWKTGMVWATWEHHRAVDWTYPKSLHELFTIPKKYWKKSVFCRYSRYYIYVVVGKIAAILVTSGRLISFTWSISHVLCICHELSCTGNPTCKIPIKAGAVDGNNMKKSSINGELPGPNLPSVCHLAGHRHGPQQGGCRCFTRNAVSVEVRISVWGNWFGCSLRGWEQKDFFDFQLQVKLEVLRVQNMPCVSILPNHRSVSMELSRGTFRKNVTAAAKQSSFDSHH